MCCRLSRLSLSLSRSPSLFSPSPALKHCSVVPPTIISTVELLDFSRTIISTLQHNLPSEALTCPNKGDGVTGTGRGSARETFWIQYGNYLGLKSTCARHAVVWLSNSSQIKVRNLGSRETLHKTTLWKNAVSSGKQNIRPAVEKKNPARVDKWKSSSPSNKVFISNSVIPVKLRSNLILLCKSKKTFLEQFNKWSFYIIRSKEKWP